MVMLLFIRSAGAVLRGMLCLTGSREPTARGWYLGVNRLVYHAICSALGLVINTELFFMQEGAAK